MNHLTDASRTSHVRAYAFALTLAIVSLCALVTTRVAHALRATATPRAVAAAHSDQVVLSGRVVYTTGDAAKGVTVRMVGPESGATVTDGGGH
ncbi:MAG: hypothetical protein QOF61_1686, partial [Acidobacteriota bacterium]|nr:hypothetical protein [Acidobacteriota bacterium]